MNSCRLSLEERANYYPYYVPMNPATESKEWWDDELVR
jgi:hypothetical protein